MQNSVILKISAALICFMALSACGQQQDSATSAVQNYVNARVAADETKLKSLTCKDKEDQAETEAASFKSMNAKLDGLTCTENGTDGQYTVVACQGTITTTYNGESTPRSLAGRNFLTIKEDGQWKFCGYQSGN